MAEYTWVDVLTDVLALIGVAWVIETAWRDIEVYLYGYSQVSVVDSVFAATFCVLSVVILRIAAIIKHGG